MHMYNKSPSTTARPTSSPQGVVKTAEAAKSAGTVGRVVLVSSMLSDPVNRFHPVRILLNNIRWSLMDYKFQSECAFA